MKKHVDDWVNDYHRTWDLGLVHAAWQILDAFLSNCASDSGVDSFWFMYSV